MILAELREGSDFDLDFNRGNIVVKLFEFIIIKIKVSYWIIYLFNAIK